MLSRVVSSLRTPEPHDETELISPCQQFEETSKRILDHASQSGIGNLLVECLMAAGSSLMSGSSDMLPAACEACKSIWYIIDAMEALSVKGRSYFFPLMSSKSDQILQYDVKDLNQGSLLGTISMVAKSFLDSKAIQIAVYYCFRNGLESALHAVLQVNLVLSYLSRSSVFFTKITFESIIQSCFHENLYKCTRVSKTIFLLFFNDLICTNFIAFI